MKKTVVIIFLYILILNVCIAQNSWRDSARKQLAEAEHDTSRVLALAELSSTYKFNRPDSAMFYAMEAITLARKIGFPKGELKAMNYIVLTQLRLGNDAQALKISLKALKIAKENNFTFDTAMELSFLGDVSQRLNDYESAMQYFRDSERLFDSIQNVSLSAMIQTKIGKLFLLLNQPDSALYFCQLAYDNRLKANWVSVYATYHLGEIHHEIGNLDLAFDYYRQSLSLTTEAADLFNSNLSIAKLYQEINDPDSSIYYAQKALGIAKESGFLKNIVDANIFLSDIFKNTNPQKALEYSDAAILYNDSLDNIRNTFAMESFLDFDEQEKLYELEMAKTEYRNRLWLNAVLGSTFTLLIIAGFLFLNNRRKQKAKQKIEYAFHKLKATQAQLIQSEKMASLGELTAGIAHEIQNPLNFVNNFSEVNRELIEELKNAVAASDQKEIQIILKDLAENEDKVKHHGKRAEEIVKGMLLHSRGNSGEMELTDINALVDEYIRLAFHGFRAKDKIFNAKYHLDLDENLPKIIVVPQDIGRVLLNLINNAFYVVSSRALVENGNNFKPNVTVSTRFLDSTIEIRIKDNGNGIPVHIQDKIFQPFYTTKPAGEGTGLGLSISYDIITKGHNGQLKVETQEGEGTEFIILLPIN